MNQILIREFKRLIEHLKNTIKTDPQNIFRIKQNKNVITILENINFKIKKANDLKDIRGIGKGTLDRINEIIKNGFLKEITTHSDVPAEIVEELTHIIGIGDKKAKELIEKYKIKSVADLIDKYNKKKIKVNDKIALGIKYFDLIKENIPRKEVTQIVKLLKIAAKIIDTDLKVVAAGSYRRGKDHSNDVDILLFHPDIETMKDLDKSKINYLSELVSLLSEPIKFNLDKPFLIDNLTDNGHTKYMGFCQYNNKIIRRLDIRYMPCESYYSALLYFTGPGGFNQHMRSHAKKRGYLINEYGIYEVGKKKAIKIDSEKDIFDLIGMEYLPPNKRLN